MEKQQPKQLFLFKTKQSAYEQIIERKDSISSESSLDEQVDNDYCFDFDEYLRATYENRYDCFERQARNLLVDTYDHSNLWH